MWDRWFKPAVVALLATLAMTGVSMSGAAPAQAASPPTFTKIDKACLLAGFTQKQCTLHGFMVIGKPKPLKVADVKGLSGLSDSDRVAMNVAAAKKKLYVRDWSQTYKSVLWSETQKGRVYFDGYKVWSTTKHKGHEGFHDCDNGWALGGTLKNLKCSTVGEYTGGMDIIDKWRAAGISQGLPFNSTHSMIFHPNGNGTYNSSWS